MSTSDYIYVVIDGENAEGVSGDEAETTENVLHTLNNVEEEAGTMAEVNEGENSLEENVLHTLNDVEEEAGTMAEVNEEGTSLDENVLHTLNNVEEEPVIMSEVNKGEIFLEENVLHTFNDVEEEARTTATMCNYIIPPPKRIADVVKSQSKLLDNSSPLHVYQIPLEEQHTNISGCRWFCFGNDTPKISRTIMVMGATGSGKSTMIDGMINYILGVRWDDDYRFKLVREVQKGTQAVSQTSEVTVYKLNHQDGFQIDYSLTIIDTPGFGDTRGIDRDMEITEMIRNLFTSTYARVFKLALVCFIVQAPLARLTHSQKYVFDSVLSIFGKDIAENIRVLVTFADGQRPPVLDAISASEVPCPQEKGVPLHFKFNNSALFAYNKSDMGEDGEEESFSEMFWKMGEKSMKKLFVALNQMRTKSLKLTNEVLIERQRLENLVDNLQKQVRVGLSKMEEIRQKSIIIKTHEAEINMNANFEFDIEVTEPRQIDISGTGLFITNCQQCHYTCHNDCAYSDDADKIHCIAMGSDGYCKVCPSKCIWSVHFNQKYRWDYVQVKKKELVKDMKKDYDIATDAKNSVEVLMQKLEDEYDEVQVEVTDMIDKLSASLNRLKEIALHPDPLSTPDYIDMLIKGEKAEAKPGWHQRVKSLMVMKAKAETIAKVNKGETTILEGHERKTRTNRSSFLITVKGPGSNFKSMPSFLTALKDKFSKSNKE